MTSTAYPTYLKNSIAIRYSICYIPISIKGQIAVSVPTTKNEDSHSLMNKM